VRDVVQQRAPELLPSMEHPDFEAGYRAEISKVQAEYLDDPATIGAIAALVRMRLDPARMPARPANPAAQSLAQNRANRAGLDQAPSARLGGAGASPADTDRRSDDAWGVRFLGRMREQMSDAQAARIEVSPEAWREVGEHQDFDSWKQARDARRERERRSGARRR
jgi:hypothetical protein